MTQPARHQCLIYDGSPAQKLPALVAAVREKLGEGYRCLYLNSAAMVADMRAALANAGVDMADEEAKGRLVLSSDQGHLVEERFDVDRMMGLLSDALAQALKDGFKGLFATGDMTWQMGPYGGEDNLLDYEWRLEEFFRHNPGLCGICQYHIDTLPAAAVREGLIAHRALFINETLIRVNPHYLPPDVFVKAVAQDSSIDEAVAALRQAQGKPDGQSH